jgi:hypothetical protein
MGVVKVYETGEPDRVVQIVNGSFPTCSRVSSGIVPVDVITVAAMGKVTGIGTLHSLPFAVTVTPVMAVLSLE